MDCGYALIGNEKYPGRFGLTKCWTSLPPLEPSPAKLFGASSLATIERIIPAVIHEDGSVHYTSVTSPSDDSIAICHVVPNRVIPVIFVPGIMGTNLQTLKKDLAWVVNSPEAMAGWALKTPAYRKLTLDPLSTAVFKGGELPVGTSLSDAQKEARGWGTVAKKSYGDWLV